ncbi:putative molybdenum carrier protein [Maridesulfovibrio salexigens]|uniref:putative molybdenum carrier protein n=1 Tax=Maridesulfovibrio salexigens TaxID=880 RepID=UPI00018A5A47|nr:putative molybdenum carrier protein [Maridesulfovibrio salexigens]
MEIPAEYGTKKYATCTRCSYTGPLATFNRQAGLFPEDITLFCSKCGSAFDSASSYFAKGSTLLKEGFTIISGGQTGVDRGALDAAIELGIHHRGWCPKGRKAEDGPIPSRYNMQETSGWQYWIRTEKNVLDSDGTLIFPGKQESKGTALTIRLARKHSRPVAVVSLENPDAGETVRAWIAARNIKIMNVAGPRESGAPGIGRKTRELLKIALTTRQVRKQQFQEESSAYRYFAGCERCPDLLQIS